MRPAAAAALLEELPDAESELAEVDGSLGFVIVLSKGLRKPVCLKK